MVINMDDVEEQLNIIFNELFGIDQPDSKITTEESEIKEENSTTIYDILNLVPGSRKTLNILFQKFNNLHDSIRAINKDEYGINKSLLRECFSISDLWEQEEKRSKFSTSSSNITLQVEAPVTFAWSNKNNKDIVKDVIQKQQKKDKMKEIQSDDQLPAVLSNVQNHKSINETLIKEMNDNLIELTKHTRSWQYILQGTEQDKTSDLQKLDNGYPDEESITNQKSEKSKSNFQVDPLEIFVATSLPRAKKNSSTKNESKKAKSKSRSLRWIWSGSTKQKHKSKEKDKNENKQSDKDGELMESVGKLDYNTDSINCTIPSVENGRYTSYTTSIDLDEAPEDELDFDLDNHFSIGSNELSSVNTTKQTNSYLNVTTNTVNKSNSKCVDRNDIDLLSRNIENIQTNSTNLQSGSNNDDDDDDFGEFETSDTGAVMSNNIIDKNTSLIDDNNTSANITNTSTDKPANPNMMPFIPLQPQKRL